MKHDHVNMTSCTKQNYIDVFCGIKVMEKI